MALSLTPDRRRLRAGARAGLLSAAALAVAACTGAAGAAGPGMSLSRTRSALLVELRGAPPRAVLHLLGAAGATLVEHDLQVWRIPGPAAGRLVPELRRRRLTRRVEVDRTLQPLSARTTATVRPESEWWLRKIGAAGLVPPGPGKPITVVDTGIDHSQPELAGNTAITTLNPQRGVELPGGFHGTAVTSLIAARGVKMIGVYPRARIREWDASPNGRLSVSRIIAGIDAAIRTGPGVINLSLGGPIDDPLLRAAVRDAIRRGSLVVAAQGQDRIDGSPPAYPADETHVLTVVATDRHDVVYFDSNGAEANDLSAPGVDVTAGVPLTANATGYETVVGNSFAAAIVSGAAAWLWTRRPSLDPTQLFELLVGTARRIANGAFNTVSGYGLLDLRAALAAPAPPPAPFEPNDDIPLVRPGGVFVHGTPLLTSPGRHGSSLRGVLYQHENPRDVFRVWIPAHGSLSATVTPRSGRVALQVWDAGTTSVLEGGAGRRRDLLADATGPGPSRVHVANPAARGTVAYVEVSIGASQTASYSLTVSSGS